jgi:hypothetical protein
MLESIKQNWKISVVETLARVVVCLDFQNAAQNTAPKSLSQRSISEVTQEG